MRYPQTLVQIHYHTRTGGVTEVMDRYARTFLLSAGTGAEAWLVGNLSSRPSRHGRRGFPVPACEYHLFRSPVAFERMRRTLARRLAEVFARAALRGPVLVVAHNLTLGKNPALTAAYRDCIQQAPHLPGSLRFFEVVHDFAEEGRLAQYRHLWELQKRGSGILSLLYDGPGQPLFLSPSRRNQLLLEDAGCVCRWLPNPVLLPKARPVVSAAARTLLERGIHRVAARDGLAWEGEAPWLFYPVRSILRKNIVEAVLVACLVMERQLVLGPPGTTPADVRLWHRLKAACRQSALPVVFDGTRAGGGGLPLSGTRSFFELLFRCSRGCISTSLAEGFGYALYEPWLYGKSVIGRNPAGFDGAGLIPAHTLYSSLRIPVEWVDLSRLAKKYRALALQMSGAQKADLLPVPTTGSCGTIDFGALDVSAQLRVLTRCAAGGTGGPLKRLVDLNPALAGQRRILDDPQKVRGLVAERSAAIRRGVGPRAFRRRFRECLLAGGSPGEPVRGASAAKYIRDFFQRPQALRLLLWQKP